MAKSINKILLLDGEYQGTWCGYTVSVTDNSQANTITCDFKVDEGIRGISFANVTVKDGFAYVQAQPVTSHSELVEGQNTKPNCE